MSSSREVLTFQFGNYSNVVGSLWLRIQEAGFSYNPNFIPDVNNDIFFQEGIDRLGTTTYNPRLIVVDHNDSGTQKTLSSVVDPQYLDADDSSARPLWDKSKVETCSSVSLPSEESSAGTSKNDWTSPLCPPLLHPRSVCLVPNHLISGLDYQNGFFGDELWDSYCFGALEDNIQTFLESCDNLQGFQILGDANTCFFGLAGSCSEYLREEFSKKSILAYPLIPVGPTARDFKIDSLLKLTIIHGLNKLCCSGDIVSPLSCSDGFGYKDPVRPRTFPNLNLDPFNGIHSGAVLAAALEGITLPFRLRENAISVDELVNIVNYNSRPLSSTSINFPFPLRLNEILEDVATNWNQPFLHSLTPGVDLDPIKINIQQVSIKGVPKNMLIHEPELTPAVRNSLFSKFVIKGFGAAVPTSFSYSSSKFRVPQQVYPKIYNAEYNLSGAQPHHVGRLDELSMATGLHSTDEMYTVIETLYQDCKINIKRLPMVKVEELEFHGLLESLVEHGKSYREGWTV